MENQTMSSTNPTQPLPARRPAPAEANEKIPEPTPLNPTLWVLITICTGLLASSLMLPIWLPGLAASILGPNPKVFWYLSRSTAIVAFIFLWLSMVWGLLVTGRLAQLWPSMAYANDLHQFTTLLGLDLGLFHGLLLLGDHYMNFSIMQVVVPFATESYRPIWVGMGQITFYLWVIVAFSFYGRKRMGQKVWRALHYASFLIFILTLVHGIFSGTDSGTIWMQMLYWGSAVSVFFLTIYRIIYSREIAMQRQAKRNTISG
jgi:predicted ferric reductase